MLGYFLKNDPDYQQYWNQQLKRFSVRKKTNKQSSTATVSNTQTSPVKTTNWYINNGYKRDYNQQKRIYVWVKEQNKSELKSSQNQSSMQKEVKQKEKVSDFEQQKKEYKDNKNNNLSQNDRKNSFQIFILKEQKQNEKTKGNQNGIFDKKENDLILDKTNNSPKLQTKTQTPTKDNQKLIAIDQTDIIHLYQNESNQKNKSKNQDKKQKEEYLKKQNKKITFINVQKVQEPKRDFKEDKVCQQENLTKSHKSQIISPCFEINGQRVANSNIKNESNKSINDEIQQYNEKEQTEKSQSQWTDYNYIPQEIKKSIRINIEDQNIQKIKEQNIRLKKKIEQLQSKSNKEKCEKLTKECQRLQILHDDIKERNKAFQEQKYKFLIKISEMQIQLSKLKQKIRQYQQKQTQTISTNKKEYEWKFQNLNQVFVKQNQKLRQKIVILEKNIIQMNGQCVKRIQLKEQQIKTLNLQYQQQQIRNQKKQINLEKNIQDYQKELKKLNQLKSNLNCQITKKNQEIKQGKQKYKQLQDFIKQKILQMSQKISPIQKQKQKKNDDYKQEQRKEKKFILNKI